MRSAGQSSSNRLSSAGSSASPRRDGGVEPDVEHVGNASVGGVPVGDRQVVDRVLVEVDFLGVDVLIDALGEFLARGDDDPVFVVVPILGGPDRQRNAPVALSGNVPVRCLLDEVSEPVVASPLGVPLAVLDVLEEVVFDVRDRNEPLVGDDLEDPRVTPPAVAVTVVDGARSEQRALVLEVGRNLVVRVLDELPSYLPASAV